MNTIGREANGIAPRVAARPLSLAMMAPGWPPDAFANGIITVVSVIAERLRADGHAVTVIADCGEEAPGDDARVVRSLRDSDHPAVRMMDRLARRASRHLGERRQVVRSYSVGCRRLIAERGLQLVEMEEGFGHARWLQRSLPIPVVVRLHGPWFLNAMDAPKDESYRHRVRVERLGIRDAFALSAPSLDVLNRTREYYGLELPDARVIPNAIPVVPEPDRWSAEGADPGEILFVGRFDRHKGGDIVIDAFAELARRRPGVRLRFVGPDRGVLDASGRHWSIGEYLADRLGPDRDRCEWMDRQPAGSLAGLRRRAGVVVVGSRYDNFPTTVLEAMAMGCPLVAARTGGIPEMVDDGANGLLFESGQAGDLARKVEVLLDDRGLAGRLGHRAGVDAGLRYSPAAVARSLEAYYREVIDAFGRRRGGG